MRIRCLELFTFVGFAFGALFTGQERIDAQDLKPVDDGIEVAPDNWPWWRGPMRNGTAYAEQSPPTEFDLEKNLLWQQTIPGRGSSSPTVVGDSVYLTSADEDSDEQMVLCFARDSGQIKWRKTVHTSGGMRKNKKATAASSSPACDGSRVYVCFPNNGRLVTTALSTGGEIVWQREISKYVVHQGYGSSPALYQDMVIVSSDNKSGGAIAALDRDTGEVVWKRDRPESPNYPSPILLNIGGSDQIIMVGCDQVVSYDPLTGKTNWETEGATTECVTSTLTDGQHVYTSGGYPKNHMSAIKADGTAAVAWENKSRLYVPSLVIHEGYLYGVLDAGIAVCWQANTGKEMWKSRLGGTFSSSPVLVGNKIFVSSESGQFFVYEANPTEYIELGRSQIGKEVFATPTIIGSKVYHRVTDDRASGRQEVLMCLGAQ
ncbi:MAG: PQQ-binding-like beta-propeller repeat protein [Pirellulaceae bacterium]